MSQSHRPSSVSIRDVHEYVQRQSKLCDSRIEAAYMRLSGSYGDGRPSLSVGLERRTRSSSSISLPPRKQLVVDTATRPSSAQEYRSTDSKIVDKPRGILKKTQSPVERSGSRRRESPDEWFQRILHVKQLSPLDLCDAFSYGDARKHPLVSLSHVCEVLFDLDPESANGADPVTEEMEEFLYQFATEEGKEIVVNIREALRALDIWQSRVISSAAQVAPSKLASDSQSKAVILESKNRKLKDVISNLQDANLRLSRQLDSAKLALSPRAADKMTPPPRSRATMKPSSVKVSPVNFKSKSKSGESSSTTQETSLSRLEIVNFHEQELVEIANKLQFTGVKKLEELLIEGDVDSTGFVELKQLCWILADHFELKISEARLIEVCMGMNFNWNAQLDYKEFVGVLMDILIYTLPDIRESAKRKSLYRLDQYLQSGFPPGREKTRQLLDELCSKYNIEGNQFISVAELIRVFHVDLVKHHAFEQPFPLAEHETIQLVHPFIQRNAQDKSSVGFLSYPELLDVIFGPFPIDINPEPNGTKQVKRALNREFWHHIYMALCVGDELVEQNVLAQLGKIMAKVEVNGTFTVSTKHFKRIFERHICSDDIEVLVAALVMSDEAEDGQSGQRLRYDVLLNLVFGSPALNDEHFFENNIRKKILREQDRLDLHMTELITAQGSSHKLTIQDFHDAFIVQAERHPLTTVEMLFLFGTVDSRHEENVQAKTLKNFLAKKCWKGVKEPHSKSQVSGSGSRGPITDVESVKKLIAKCCTGYNLQRILDDLSRRTQGWISQVSMVKKLTEMLHEMGIVGVHQDDLTGLVQHISQNTSGSPNSSMRNSIHCDAFFDALVDWNTVINSMRLPDSLVEVKKVFERFDWDHMGTICCEDWNKAYCLICCDEQELPEWEILVLQRRFPGQEHHQDQELMIDYARVIVFLLAYQQQQTRKNLQLRVVQHFQRRFTSTHGTMSTAELERFYRALDRDSKGYFNVGDLKTYLTKEFVKEDEQEPDQDNTTALLNSTDALASVMRLLAGDKLDQTRGHTSDDNAVSQTVVTFERFREIASSFSHTSSKSLSLAGSRSQISHRGSRVNASLSQSGRLSELSPAKSESQTISSLRVLEFTILEISNEFADMKGNILPARAFRYFSFGPTASPPRAFRATPPSSPLRRSSLSSPKNRSSGLSVINRKKQRELEASNLDPLTPARLKQLLQVYHNVEVSTHLISQFFLHIGSTSKYFLDLLHFAQWAAPLSVELQVKVRGAVRQMIVKGKGGGGRLDLDRLIAQLQRRLQDSPQYMASMGSFENPPLQFVSMSLLVSKLHQLNIPLHKQELMTLLRHFGMEEDLEAVDYALFLQRLYELDSSMTA